MLVSAQIHMLTGHQTYGTFIVLMKCLQKTVFCKCQVSLFWWISVCVVLVNPRGVAEAPTIFLIVITHTHTHKGTISTEHALLKDEKVKRMKNGCVSLTLTTSHTTINVTTCQVQAQCHSLIP